MKNKKIITAPSIMRAVAGYTLTFITIKKIDAANIGSSSIRKGKNRSLTREKKKTLPYMFSLIGFTLFFTTIGANANIIENTIPPFPSQLATDYVSGRINDRDHKGYAQLRASRLARFDCFNGHSGLVNGTLVNNIAYFSQNGRPNNGGIDLTFSNCTRLNPCGPTDFSQIGVNRLNNLLPHTTMFFNGGRYPLKDEWYGEIVFLKPGQSLHSRTADYKLPATGAARSIFYDGTLALTGNNTVDSIIAFANPIHRENLNILVVDGANNVITNSQIGEESIFGGEARSDIAIFLRGDSENKRASALIDNCMIAANRIGIFALYYTDFTLQNNSLIRIDAHDETRPAYGLEIDRFSSANIKNSTIKVANPLGPGETVGIKAGIIASSQVDASYIDAHCGACTSTAAIALLHGSNNITSNTVLKVDGVNPIIAQASGPPGSILINNSSCFVNGRIVPCPASTP